MRGPELRKLVKVVVGQRGDSGAENGRCRRSEGETRR